MDANQQIGEIRRELNCPCLAKQRFEENYQPSIGRAESFKSLFRPSSSWVFINPRDWEKVRREAAETSPTLVDYCEKADHSERKELFKAIVRENWDLDNIRNYLGKWSTEFGQAFNEVALLER